VKRDRQMDRKREKECFKRPGEFSALNGGLSSLLRDHWRIAPLNALNEP